MDRFKIQVGAAVSKSTQLRKKKKSQSFYTSSSDWLVETQGFGNEFLTPRTGSWNRVSAPNNINRAVHPAEPPETLPIATEYLSPLSLLPAHHSHSLPPRQNYFQRQVVAILPSIQTEASYRM